MLKLHQLKAAEKTCSVEYGGESFDVGYKPSAYTPNTESAFYARLRANTPAGAYAALLLNVLTWWDVEGEDGEQLPVTEDTLSEMPGRLLGAIVAAIADDMSEKPETEKNLDGGSRRKAK